MFDTNCPVCRTAEIISGKWTLLIIRDLADSSLRFCELVKRMSAQTQFLFISHNKISMEMAAQLIGVTMPESGVSRVVAVDIDEALRIREELAA